MQYVNDTNRRYRYGFNGIESSSSSLDLYFAEDRIYDPRISRWFSIDPEASEFPDETPYSNNLNSPISICDQKGDIGIFGALGAGLMEMGGQMIANGWRPWKLSTYSSSFKKMDWLDVGVASVAGATGAYFLNATRKAFKYGKAIQKATRLVVKNWDDAVTSSINYQYNKESNEYSFSFNSPGKSTFGFFFNKIGKGVAGYTVGRIIKPMVANSNSLIRKALEKQSKALIEAGKYSRTIIKPKSPAQTRIKELVFTQKSQDAFQATLNADVAAAYRQRCRTNNRRSKHRKLRPKYYHDQQRQMT